MNNGERSQPEVVAYRCHDCNQLMTSLTIFRLGNCPKCGSVMYRGTNFKWYHQILFNIGFYR